MQPPSHSTSALQFFRSHSPSSLGYPSGPCAHAPASAAPLLSLQAQIRSACRALLRPHSRQFWLSSPQSRRPPRFHPASGPAGCLRSICLFRGILSRLPRKLDSHGRARLACFFSLLSMVMQWLSLQIRWTITRTHSHILLRSPANTSAAAAPLRTISNFLPGGHFRPETASASLAPSMMNSLQATRSACASTTAASMHRGMRPSLAQSRRRTQCNRTPDRPDSLTEIRYRSRLPQILTGSSIYTCHVTQSLETLDWRGFLARPHLPSPPREALETLARNPILITGAGGSIGSALALNLSAITPKIVLLEASESHLFALQSAHSAWAETIGQSNVSFVLGSVADAALLDEIFSIHSPRLVFHAAAFRHVPLMEEQPLAAIPTMSSAPLRSFAQHPRMVHTLYCSRQIKPSNRLPSWAPQSEWQNSSFWLPAAPSFASGT